MKYLITGTGRCGTGYIAMVLRGAGVKCGHENVFGRTGIESARLWDADSSWYAAFYLDDPILDGLTIVHLVRHPKEVIDSQLSMKNWTHPAYNGAETLLPYLPSLAPCRTPLEMSARWYLEVNRLIEPHADIFH